jgi:hypothetical protein
MGYGPQPLLRELLDEIGNELVGEHKNKSRVAYAYFALMR